MRAVIHQPQYLPYLGYFYKVSLGDVFVILDHVQYSKNGVQNRNVIRGPDEPMQLTVPVLTTGNFGAAIDEIEIDNTQPWSRKHWGSIEQAYSGYPYFEEYGPALEETYDREWTRLVNLNLHLMDLLMEWLGLEVVTVRSSELGLESSKTELLVDLCREVGADVYVSGSGARSYLETREFAEAGISLVWSEFRHPEYHQHESPFVPELSALDLALNLGPRSREVLEEARQISRVLPEESEETGA